MSSRILGVITKNGQPYLNYTNIIGPNATYQCDANGALAMTDTWSTCMAFQLPFFLEKVGFGYLTLALSLVIILLSLFGGIKDNYRWYILSQASWDLLISYDFICDKPSHRYFTNADPKTAGDLWNQGPSTCFYSTTAASPSWGYVLKHAIDLLVHYIPFSQVLLLSFSRVAAVYFPVLYNQHNTPKKTIIMLIIFNAASALLINAETIYSQARHLTALAYCNCPSCPVYDSCVIKFFKDTSTPFVLMGVPPITSLLFLSITATMTILVCGRLVWQLKFAYQFNRKNLPQSIRISAVLFFQFLMAFWIFLFIFFGEFLQVWVYGFVYNFIDTSLAATIIPYTPIWVKQLNNVQECLNILRSFIDAVIIFILLSGYRTGIKRFAYMAANPRKTLRGENSHLTTTAMILSDGSSFRSKRGPMSTFSISHGRQNKCGPSSC